MKSKITLYTDKELIEQIKQYAKEQHTSVSKIVNNFFENLLLNREYSNNAQKNKITNSIDGILKDSSINTNDYKKFLEDKYLWKFY